MHRSFWTTRGDGWEVVELIDGSSCRPQQQYVLMSKEKDREVSSVFDSDMGFSVGVAILYTPTPYPTLSWHVLA